MYGSTCADMQVDVMGECLSSIKHVVGTTSGCFYPRSNPLEEGRSVKSGAAEFGIAHSIVSRLWKQFQTTGTAIRGFSSGRPREPRPQMTGTLSYRPEKTGGRQCEKSLDTRHRRLDDQYRVLPWPEDCTVVMRADSVRVAILIAYSTGESGEAAIIPRTSLKGTGAMGLQFLFMDDNAPCHRTVAAKQLLESSRLAARTLPPVTIRKLRLALQDEWAAMSQQLIGTLIVRMGRRCETCLAVRRDHIPY
ncbi:transposable element Tcb2 transposase [Trichonephila clavipes]|nr:transposable element Tcb2 transposase [Trichonephila clavipes]